jgi:hypothetical protein
MEIALVILSVMSVSFLIAYLSVSHKLNVINKGFAQLFIAYNTLRDVVEGKPSKTEEDIHKENFIKFLSDSRDWAFDYIEDVQKGLSKFIQEVEPQLEYYNEYGVIIEGMVPPHDFALKKISKEFEELKKLLPEETDDRR